MLFRSCAVVCPVKHKMRMEVGLPILGFLIALVPMDSDLEDLDAEPIAISIGQSVEVCHGSTLLDHDNTLTDWGCLGLHLLPCLGLVQGFDVGKAVGLCVALPIFVEVGQVLANVVKLLLALVVFLAATFDRLHVDGGLFCHSVTFLVSGGHGVGRGLPLPPRRAHNPARVIVCYHHTA